jgi:hypothetical protein
VSKIISIVFVTALAISFNVNAMTMYVDRTSSDYTTQVDDGLDPIIAYTSIGKSSVETEMAWMTEALTEIYGADNFDPIWTLEKIELEGKDTIDEFWGSPIGTDSKGGDIHSGNLLYGQEHYLIKIGGGNVQFDTFLLQNLSLSEIATIGLGWLDHFSKLDGPAFDIYRISHISEVPVPAAFWLFGTALIGFIGFSRKTSV